MTLVQGYSKTLARIAAVLMVGAALSACSSVPDWVDPTTWVGGDDSSASSQLPSDDQSADSDQSSDSDQSADQSDDQSNGDQQGLAYIPDRPAASSTPAEQQQVADTLKADRAKSHYSGQVLRGDAEPSTAAPSPEPEQTADATAPASQAAPAEEPAAAPTTQVASASEPMTTTSSTGPAVPPTSGMVAAPGQSQSDAALGFKPSKAPPLDSSVAQFVAPPIMSRFQQTASTSTSAAISSPAVPAVPSGPGMGGPEEMTGAVVANLDALQPAPAADQASTYANPAGLPPAAVIFFPHDTTVLNAEGREQVRSAVAAYMAKGGQGYIRVVGHSSSRTANMPLARHLVFNFERSQARATAVAKELIHEGVPADKVLVEAVGDSQPVYYESMPQGEEGNRRAEIFIQS